MSSDLSDQRLDIEGTSPSDDELDASATVANQSPAHGSGAGAPALVCALVGVCLVRLVTTGHYKRYVRVGMGPILMISGFVLILAAAVTWWSSRRGRSDSHEHDHDHEHEHEHEHDHEHDHEHEHDDHEHDDHEHDEHGRIAVGWLLLVPVLTVFAIAPPGLGSFALSRALSSTSVQQGSGSFADLTGTDPVGMLLKEFDERAFDRAGVSFAGVPVSVVGFVAKAPQGDGFIVARFQIACCAADGRANLAHVTGYAGTVPPVDSWVQITGSFHAGAGPQQAPLLVAATVTPIAQPSDPYEPN